MSIYRCPAETEQDGERNGGVAKEKDPGDDERGAFDEGGRVMIFEAEGLAGGADAMAEVKGEETDADELE
jgi:hypothetical protein